MGLLRPELLLLLIPLALSWRAWGSTRPGLEGLRGIGGLRLVIALLLVLAAAGLYLPLEEPGRDVIVLVDGSASMPEEANGRAEQILRLLEDERAPGDRVGVVSFGAEVRVLRAPSATARSSGLPALDGTASAGSDLAAALEAGLAMLPAERAGRLLLISDGLYDGEDPSVLARRAGARGIPVDVRPLSRSWGEGARTLGLDLPSEVEPGAPIGMVGWVHADRDGPARYTLSRGDQVLRSGETALKAGSNRLLFRDLAPEAGLATYTLVVHQEGDAHLEDDRAMAVSRVVGSRGVLVVNQDGGRSALADALIGAGMKVALASPEQAPRAQSGLEPYRVVVLENVEADRLGTGLGALAGFVEDGGGLLMTGGGASFGVGGYHASELDPWLPVSMEQRIEQREQGMALAIAMDRSGSMAEDVGGGRTKMDLANVGAAAAIRLLGPMDHVGVLAVDTAAHVVADMQPATDPGAIAARVQRVRSEGGGIYVMTGLASAARMLESAPQENRHITLFADAADSEEPEGVPELLARLQEAGVSVSVIALGSKFDTDANFLESVASQGGGTIAFTMRPAELPRLFARDTLLASRASVVLEPTGTTPRAELQALGLSFTRGPRLDGYNRAWPRPGALIGLVSADDNASPVLAWRQAGAGRTAAYTGQVGGSWGAAMLGWEGANPTLVSLVRWLGAQEAPSGWYATSAREGQEMVITVERDPATANGATPVARLRDPDGGTRQITLEPEGPDRWVGRARLQDEGVTLGVVGLSPEGSSEAGSGDETQLSLSVPPVAMAGSTELNRPPDPNQGERLMRRLAASSGGTVNAPVSELFTGEVRSREGRVLSGWLLGMALALTLAETAARRFWRERSPSTRRSPTAAPLATRDAPRAAPTPRADTSAAEAPAPKPAQDTVEGGSSDVASALASARRRAGKELDRRG